MRHSTIFYGLVGDDTMPPARQIALVRVWKTITGRTDQEPTGDYFGTMTEARRTMNAMNDALWRRQGFAFVRPEGE